MLTGWHRYLELIRTIIQRYSLEPAGSHGVWGLDDHSFIPYIFGAAQLAPAVAESDTLPEEGSLPDAPDPGGVAKANVVERERKTNMYFSAVGFIYDVKRGPFWEHSPMLYDISGVRAGWAKINKVSFLFLSFTSQDLTLWLGYDQNVQRRSPFKVPRRPALPLRLAIQLRAGSQRRPSGPNTIRTTIRSTGTVSRIRNQSPLGCWQYRRSTTRRNSSTVGNEERGWWYCICKYIENTTRYISPGYFEVTAGPYDSY